MEVVKLYIGAEILEKEDEEFDQAYAKIDSEDALKKFIEVFKTHRDILYPSDIESHIERALKTSLESEISNFEAWSYLETDRPTKDEAEEYRNKFTAQNSALSMLMNFGQSGTDMRVVTYENDAWGKQDMGLRVSIFVEFGVVLGYFVDIDFDQEFFL